MDIPQTAPLGFLHDRFDGFIVAVKVPLHGAVNPCLCGNGIQLCIQASHLLDQFISALCAGALAQGVACNGIVCRCDGFLCVAQFLTRGTQMVTGFLFPRFTGFQVFFQLCKTGLGLLHRIFQAPHIRLPAGNICRKGGLLGTKIKELLVSALCVCCQGCQFLLQLLEFCLLCLQIFSDFADTLLCLFNLGKDSAVSVFLTLKILFDTLDVGIVVFHIAPQHGHLTIHLLMGCLHHADFQTHCFQFTVFFPQHFAHFFCLPVELFQILMSLLQHKGRGRVILLCLFRGSGKFFQRIQPDRHFDALQFILQFQILLCFFRLHLQRFQLQFQFRDLIADTEQIVLRPLQFPLGFFLAVAVFGDTCRLFENLTAVGALQRENLIDSALSDIGVTFLAHTGIHEHLIDVTKSGRLAVDIIFTVTAAVIPAGNHDFICVIGQCTVRIVQCQRCFRKTHGTAFLGSAENHVLHLGTTKRFTALLAHNPQDGIGNIRFSGAVGADDGGDVITEADQRFVRKGLKTLQFQTF